MLSFCWNVAPHTNVETKLDINPIAKKLFSSVIEFNRGNLLRYLLFMLYAVRKSGIVRDALSRMQRACCCIVAGWFVLNCRVYSANPDRIICIRTCISIDVTQRLITIFYLSLKGVLHSVLIHWLVSANFFL